MKLSSLPVIKGLGDSALTAFFGDSIDPEINKRVLSFFKYLKKLNAPFVYDLIPAYSSLTICYDPCHVNEGIEPEIGAFRFMQLWTMAMLEAAPDPENTPHREMKIPVCYSSFYGKDLKEMSEKHSLTIEEIVALHTTSVYRVFMIGFLPGFPYMGTVNERIRFPRKSTPRSVVDAGSIGIAGLQTGIYPINSPGGWQIIGRTPVKLFNKMNTEPVLFEPGDEVSFYSITEDEFANY